MDKHTQLFQQAEAETEIARGDDLVSIRWMQQSLRGDPSLIPAVAQQIGSRLVHEDHIPANERIWLALMLARLYQSPEAARIISGAGRGAPKNGLKGAIVASEVMDSIFADGAQSVDDALAEVATKKHMSIDAVKKHWAKNQDMLWDRFGETLRTAGFADFRNAVQAATTDNREKVKK